MPAIITYTGRRVDLCDPDPASIDILDIAHALAMQCRWNGHTTKFYSVAQHSVMVSDLVPTDEALIGLLHDAAEAYLGDVVRPLKQMYGRTWTAIENCMSVAIGRRFGVKLLTLPESVQEADDILLATEARDLMREGCVILDRDGFPRLCSPLTNPIRPCGPEIAQAEFLQRFHSLGGK